MDCKNDIEDLTGFKPVEDYGSITPYENEIGAVAGVRFLTSTLYTALADSGTGKSHTPTGGSAVTLISTVSESSTNMTFTANSTYIGYLSSSAVTETLPTFVYPEACRVVNGVTGVDVSPQSSWTNATLLNDWAAGDVTPQYRLFRGRVELRGSLDGTGASSTIAFTLPSGSRPNSNSVFLVPYGSAYTCDGTVAMRIATSGNVAGISTVYAVDEILLDGIAFSPAE